MNLSKNARIILERRYLKKDDKGKVIETTEEMFARVAKNIASAGRFYNETEKEISQTEQQFYEIMTNLEFLPNSPTLMNAGRDLQQLSACFVLPIDDSMHSIFEIVKDTALIHKSGGGTGFSFSRLRPKNDRVKTTGGVASGPVSFMKVFNAATEAVKQGGTRRGANMGILEISHPDIVDFITAKQDTNELTNFNISVAITDKFMKALKEDKEFELINPHTKKVVKKVKAAELFNLIIEHAYNNGEPGIVFIDSINKDNPTPKLGRIESTNPCGEQPLLPYESCNLGSINLAKMLIEENGKMQIDWEKLKRTVHISVKFLDNVIDMNRYPLEQIEKMTKGNRKIGLGVMGFADMLVQLMIPYNSDKAVKLAEKIMKFIKENATLASIELAKKRGVFPNYEMSIHKDKNLKLRNASLTTIAPTGTLSMIADCSSGIEPYFALAFIKNVLDDDKLPTINNYFVKIAKKEGFYSKRLMEEVEKKGCLRDTEGVPERIKKVFVTALEISPYWHIRMQAAFQKYTDNGVSKTINFPYDAKKEDVKEAFLLAYKSGCKGLTIYRDRSRDKQVLSIKREEEKRKVLQPRERPLETYGQTIKMQTGCGNLYVTVNEDNVGLCEVFSTMGKAGGCAASQLEAISRLVSLALRSGVEIDAIIKQLKGIRCPAPQLRPGGFIFSCADAIAKVLEQYVNSNKKEERYNEISNKLIKIHSVVGVCLDCGSSLVHEEGCVVCKICGYTKCG